MRQIMPHRNNIDLAGFKCKIFLSEYIEIHASATFLPQRGNVRSAKVEKFLILNNGLYVLQMFTTDASPANCHS
jgi:hypothetical protein